MSHENCVEIIKMTESVQIFNEILNHLNKEIEKTQILSSDSKQISPDQFLEQHFKKELTMLVYLSKVKFPEVLALLLDSASRILKQATIKDFKINQSNSLSIYYALGSKCCNSTEHKLNQSSDFEVVISKDQDIKTQLIEQSTFIFSELPSETLNVRTYFSLFLTSLGAHFEAIYSILFDNVINFLDSNLLDKKTPLLLAPLSSLPSSSTSLGLFLSHVLPLLTSPNLKPNYREQVSTMICNSIINSLKFHFLDGHSSKLPLFPYSSQISEQLEQWREKHNNFVWPTQIALFFISKDKNFQMSQNTDDSLFDCMAHFPDIKGFQKEPTMGSLMVIFRIYSLSCNNIIAKTCCMNYFNSFLDFFLNPKNSKDATLLYTPPNSAFGKSIFIDFPVCVLYNQKELFRDKIIPFLNDRVDGKLIISKIIRRICSQASILKDDSILELLIEPTISILKNLKNETEQKQNKILLSLISAFKNHIGFLRNLFLTTTDTVSLFISVAENHLEIPWQRALLPFFEDFSDVNSLSIVASLVTFLFNTFINTTLYSKTYFSENIPLLLRNAALCPVFQQERYNGISKENTKNIIDNLKIIIKTFEASSILLFASSKKEWRRYGANLLNDTLNIIHSIPLMEDLINSIEFEFPSNIYQTLATEALRTKPTTGHAIYKTPLRSVNPPDASDGYIMAWPPLYQYFLALTNVINPEIGIELPKNDTSFLKTIPISQITEEWIGCTSILLSITVSHLPLKRLFEQIFLLLKDQGDIGNYTVVTIPSALNISKFTEFVNTIVSTVESLKNQDVFEINLTNSNTIENLMKVMRGLSEQSCWDKEIISNNLNSFVSIIQNFVNYSNLVPDIELRRSCSQCIMAIAKLLADNDVELLPTLRHEVAKTLLNWLSTYINESTTPIRRSSLTDLCNNRNMISPTAGSKAKQFFSVIQSALATLLDNLSLMDCTDPNDPKTPEEQAENQFMIYFIAIKQMLETNFKEHCKELIPVLSALLKQNLTLGLEQCISMGFSSPYEVRAAFIGSLASVFKIPEEKVSSEEIGENNSLICILYSNGFDLVEYLAGKIPYSRADVFGAAALEAAMINNIEFPFLERMIDIELKTIDENSKNTLFRGNAVPARAVGHYPRIVGNKWMIETLKPLFEEVIENCEVKKYSYIVDPKRVTDPNELEENKAHFRELMDKSVDVINQASEIIPNGLIREMQLIYRKVSEKYGNFAIQILGGFLFLRFLLPAFTVPKLVGLPELLPEAPRQALIQTSTMLMASINKGSLEDKAEHFQCFNDIAARAYKVFNQMFLRIIEKDIGEEASEIIIDEEKVTETLHTEIWPLIPQIQEAVSSNTPLLLSSKKNNQNSDQNDENETLRNDLKFLLQKLQSMGQPKSVALKAALARNNAETKDEKGKGKSSLDNLLKMKFKDELLQELSTLISREEAQPTASDGSTIYNISLDRLSQVTNTYVVPYIIIKKLMEETNSKVTVILYLSNFDETKIPSPSLLKTYSEMPPVQKIVRYILLDPNSNFVQFASRNPQLFETPQRFYQVSSLAEFNDLIGQPPSGKSKYVLPQMTLESLTKPESIQRAFVNKIECNVRIHQNSIQFSSIPEVVNSYKFSSIQVILPKQISSLVESDPDSQLKKGSQFIFEIHTKDGGVFTLESQNSSLLDSVSAIYRRTFSLEQMINKVKKVDVSTLQWLMLNLAFVNMVDEGVTPSVRKAALDLIYAVFSAFSFKRESKVAKLPMESLPENLLGFVTTLSEDIAKHNPESYGDFMTEFFNAIHDLTPINRVATFNYLRPWVPFWAADIERHQEFISYIIKCFLELKDESAAFSLNIWDIIVENEKGCEYLMRYIFKTGNESLIEIITSFAVKKPEMVSRFWGSIMMKECISNKDNKILYVSKVITILLASHLFNDNSSLVELVFNVLSLRLVYNRNILSQIVELFGNILHSLIRLNTCSLDIDFTDVCEAFCSDTQFIESYTNTNNQASIENNNQQLRRWLLNTKLIAKTVKEIFGENKNSIDQLYSIFSQQIQIEQTSKSKDNLCNLRNAANIIYSAAFTEEHSIEFSKKIISLVKMNKDIITNSASCIGLSMIEMNIELASKLFFFGVAEALYIQNGPAIDLIASSIRQVFNNNNNVLSCFDPQIIEILSSFTKLKFEEKPIYSALVLFGLFCDDEISSNINDVIASKVDDPFAKVLSLFNQSDNYETIADYDFESEFATIAALSLMILQKFHIDFDNLSSPVKPGEQTPLTSNTNSNKLLDYLLHLLENRPKIFGCFDCLSDYGVSLLESIGSPTLAAQIYYASLEKSEDYILTPLLKNVFVEGKLPDPLGTSQLDAICDILF